MAAPDFTMRQLLEAGVHFGHQKHRWNPKMSGYIYGIRNNIHIIDLAQTVPLLHRALQAVIDVVAGGGRVLFVGTKRQASEPIAAAAKQSAQYYVNSRWLGGMLTNWKTISNSISRLRELDGLLDGEAQGLTKKERLSLTRERDRLENALGGIKEMGGVPDLLFVIDTNKEAIAVKEAQRLGIPVAAILDSNSDPRDIAFPIPGNDDAGRAISLYCDLVAKAAIEGISRGQGRAGIDIGEAVNPVAEKLDGRRAVLEPVGNDDVDSAGASGDAMPFARPAGDPDDLKKITGVGPVLERKLNALGITRFDQIAAFTAEDLAKVDELLNFKGRAERDDWVGQARGLAGAD
jgi:small subunit ribosomal protein S2